MPDMIYVDSSNVEAIGYEDTGMELHVQFLGGGLYVYHDVPREVYDDFMAAPSKGSFLNRVIKGVYQFTKQ
jgi:hypothetical protein